MQIIILKVLPEGLGISGANNAKNLLRAALLVQYIPRLWRFIPLLIGQSPSGFIFETALANFVINLFTYILSAHIVGSWWYLLGLQVSMLSFISQTFSYPLNIQKLLCILSLFWISSIHRCIHIFSMSSHPRSPHNIQSLVLNLWSDDRLKVIFCFK